MIAFDALSTFVVAVVQREAAGDRAGTTGHRLMHINELPEPTYRNVRELVGLLVGRNGASRFDDGLRLMLAGIEAKSAQRDAAPPREQ